MPHRERLRRYRLASSAPPPPSVSDRALGAALFAGGAFGVALSVTVLWLSMRAVLDIGGFCAQGGPFVIEDPCPGATAWLTPASILVGAASVGVMLWGATRMDGGVIGLVFLAWPALFLSLGWNFLQYGFRPPDGGGPVIGWLVCGVAFVALAAGGYPFVRRALAELEPPRGCALGLLATGAVMGVPLGVLLYRVLS